MCRLRISTMINVRISYQTWQSISSSSIFDRNLIWSNHKSLDLIIKSSRNCLNNSSCHLLMIFLEIKSKSLHCLLHRLIDQDIEYKHSVMAYTYYNVSLCVHWYKVFHTMKHLNSLNQYTSDLILKYNHCLGIRQK